MARTTLEEVSEDYPYLTLKEREDYARYLQMLEGWNEVDWNEGKGFPLIDDPPPPPPPSDPPKWRGEAEIYFNNHPRYCNKKPGYGIDDRVTDIALGFTFSDGRDESDESDVEDEDEETVEWLKGLLDELQAYDIESTDVATLLHSIGCLIPFLGGVLSNKHACIRAKAAELITSMVQNRPTSQQLVIQANGLQLLLNNFTADPDTTSRTKALGAISSLIRNNKSGITVFLRENGYEALRNAASGSSTHNDEVVDLIGYLRRENSLYGDDDSDVQEARNSGKAPDIGIKHRSRAIAGFFEIPKKRSESDDEEEEEDGPSVKWLKVWLDELQEYDVESIDVATVLHSDGYLVPFVRNVLSNKHACIRAKAAELITSMVQNHPTSQQLVIEANGLQLLLHNFTTDPDTTSRTKALGAISSLIRNNKSGITVFLRENGYEALRNAASGSSTHNDEVVDLIGYLRRESSLLLYGDDDSDVQEARNSGQQLGKNDDKLKQDNSKKRRNYSSLKRRLKPFNKLHLPPFQKKRKKQFKLEKNEAPLNL